MLRSDVTWMDPGYKSRLRVGQKDDYVVRRDDEDSFVLCPGEETRTWAKVVIRNPLNYINKSGRCRGSRPHSAVPVVRIRTSGHTNDISQPLGQENEGVDLEHIFDSVTGKLSRSRSQSRRRRSHPSRPSTAGSIREPSSPLLFTRTASSKPLLSRPRSAQQQPVGDVTVPKSLHRRPPSAPARTSPGVSTNANSIIVLQAWTSTPNSRRIHDDRSIQLNGLNETEVDDEMKSKVPFQPDPDQSYFSRHSRCLNHTYLRSKLLHNRPQPVSEAPYSRGHYERPASANDSVYCKHCDTHEEYPERIQRYVDVHRPRTAPSTRKEVQGLSKTSYVMRGDLPHFCNIVQAVSLHDRESSTDDSDGMGFDRRNRAGIGADIDKVPESQQFESVYSDDGAHPDSPVHRGQGDGAEYSSDEFNVIALPAKELPSESIDNTSGILHGTGSSSHDLDNENGDVTITAVDKNGIRDRNIIRIPTPAPDDENIGLDDDGDQRNDGVVDGALTTKRSVSPSKILVAPIPTSSSNSRTTSSFGDKKHKNRACIHKREKKGDKRVKKGKEETIVPAEDDNQHTHDDVTPGRSTLTNNTESTPTAKANLNVPMLPNYHGKLSEKRSSRHRRNSIARHHSSSSKPPTGQTRKTSTGSDITTNQSPYDFPVDNSMAVTMAKNSLRVQPWLHARLALSQEACRFELPMDMKVLETMSPQDYIRRYCVVSPKRQYLYQKIFYRHRDRTDTIPLQSLEKSLKDVLVSTITSQQVLDLCTISEVTSESNIDYKLFCGLSALAERVLYPEYITEETAHLPEHRRDKLECADFSALEWKLKGVNVNPPVHKILKSIA